MTPHPLNEAKIGSECENALNRFLSFEYITMYQTNNVMVFLPLLTLAPDFKYLTINNFLLKQCINHDHQVFLTSLQSNL